MKNFLLIGLLCLAIAFGSSCKKDDQQDQKPKTENVNDRNVAVNEWPDNEFSFPHNTGACTCGRFPKCHPEKHNTPEEDCELCQNYPPK